MWDSPIRNSPKPHSIACSLLASQFTQTLSRVRALMSQDKTMSFQANKQLASRYTTSDLATHITFFVLLESFCLRVSLFGIINSFFISILAWCIPVWLVASAATSGATQSDLNCGRSSSLLLLLLLLHQLLHHCTPDPSDLILQLEVWSSSASNKCNTDHCTPHPSDKHTSSLKFEVVVLPSACNKCNTARLIHLMILARPISYALLQW